MKKIFYFGAYRDFIDFSYKYKERVGWENLYHTPCFPCEPAYILSGFEMERTILTSANKTTEIYKDLGAELADIILVFDKNFSEEDRFRINPLCEQLAEVIGPCQFDDYLNKYFPIDPVKKIEEKYTRFSLMEIE